MQPTGTTTTTEIWQWQCAVCRADWKMLRQVTTTSPHGHGCQGGPPPSAGNPPLSPAQHHHHHHHGGHLHQEEGTRALAAPHEGSDAGRKRDNITALSPTPLAVAQVCWVPDPYLMVQQLREFEPLNHEAVALRVQLQEYAWEIDRSIKSDDTNWFLDLPASVRDVLVMARDAIESFIAFSTTAPAN
ncbi:unnamed protein product [Urochloa humidicola]